MADRAIVLAQDPVRRRPAGALLYLPRFARRQPLSAACGVLLLALVVVAGLADLVAPYSPTKIDAGPPLAGPGSAHMFGTDQFGRDILSRVIHGARTSLYVGLGSTLAA